MISVLIITHGRLAQELLTTAETIAGERFPCFAALCLDWDDGFEEAREKAVGALGRMDMEGGVLILSDLFGATPTNVALSLGEPGRVEVVTGVNLAMVVRLGCHAGREMGVEEAARWIQEKGRTSICRGPELRGEGAPPQAAPSTGKEWK